MKKNNKIYLLIFAMLFGFLLNAFAWTILSGPTFSTIGLLLGLLLMFGGFISLMIILFER